MAQSIFRKLQGKLFCAILFLFSFVSDPLIRSTQIHFCLRSAHLITLCHRSLPARSTLGYLVVSRQSYLNWLKDIMIILQYSKGWPLKRHHTRFGSYQKDEAAPGDVDGGHPHHWRSCPECGRRSRRQRRTNSIGARVIVTKKVLSKQTRVGLKVYFLLVVSSVKKVNLRGGGESPENIGEVRLGGGEEYASWFTWLGSRACCCEVKIPNQYGGVILWCLFMYRIDLWL